MKRCVPIFAAGLRHFLFWLRTWLACTCLKVTRNASTFRTCLLGALHVYATELMLLRCPVMTSLTQSWRFDTYSMRQDLTDCLPCVMLLEIVVKTSTMICATRQRHLNVCMARDVKIESKIEMVYLFMRYKRQGAWWICNVTKHQLRAIVGFLFSFLLLLQSSFRHMFGHCFHDGHAVKISVTFSRASAGCALVADLLCCSHIVTDCWWRNKLKKKLRYVEKNSA